MCYACENGLLNVCVRACYLLLVQLEGGLDEVAQGSQLLLLLILGLFDLDAGIGSVVQTQGGQKETLASNCDHEKRQKETTYVVEVSGQLLNVLLQLVGRLQAVLEETATDAPLSFIFQLSRTVPSFGVVS